MASPLGLVVGLSFPILRVISSVTDDAATEACYEAENPQLATDSQVPRSSSRITRRNQPHATAPLRAGGQAGLAGHLVCYSAKLYCCSGKTKRFRPNVWLAEQRGWCALDQGGVFLSDLGSRALSTACVCRPTRGSVESIGRTSTDIQPRTDPSFETPRTPGISTTTSQPRSAICYACSSLAHG